MTEDLVTIRSKLDPRLLGSDVSLEAISLTCSKNAILSCSGRSLKTPKTDCSRISEFPLSRLAPARKSVQIISKQ